MLSKSNPGRGALLTPRVVWAVVFALLLTLVVVGLAGGGALPGLSDQWLVGQGLPAAAALVPPELFFVYLLALRHTALAIFWLVALMIFWRRPDDWVALPVSWGLLLMPFSLVFGGDETAWQTILTYMGLALFLLMLFAIPDGRFIPQAINRRLLLVFILVFTPFLSLELTGTLLTGYAPDELTFLAFLVTLFVTLACGIGSQVYRYRFMSKDEQRQQTKWVLFGLAAQLIWIFWWLLYIFLPLTLNDNATWSLVTLHINLLVPVLIPFAFGVAMLRYRLWDIDIIIRRTLLYGLPMAILVLIYHSSVVLMQSFFSAVSGPRSVLVIIISTLAIAYLFQPLRRRVQGFIDRRFYRRNYDSAKMLSSFASTARDQVNLEELSQTLLRVVEARMQPAHCSLCIKMETPQPSFVDYQLEVADVCPIL